ncbi:hypothetical protein [Puia sp.]
MRRLSTGLASAVLIV